MLVCGPCALAGFWLKPQLEAVVQRSQPSGCGQGWGPGGSFSWCQQMLVTLEVCYAGAWQGGGEDVCSCIHHLPLLAERSQNTFKLMLGGLFRLFWCVIPTLPRRQWLSMVRKPMSSCFSTALLLPWEPTGANSLDSPPRLPPAAAAGSTAGILESSPFPPILSKVRARWQPCQSNAAVCLIFIGNVQKIQCPERTFFFVIEQSRKGHVKLAAPSLLTMDAQLAKPHCCYWNSLVQGLRFISSTHSCVCTWAEHPWPLQSRQGGMISLPPAAVRLLWAAAIKWPAAAGAWSSCP